MDELQHECGVAALYDLGGNRSGVWNGDPDEVARLMPRMLLDLQNRGQLAAGMSGYRPDRGKLLDTYKDLGPVSEAFRMARPEKHASILENHGGRACIGHVRYATCGQDSREYAQPFERKHSQKSKWFAFAFNGQLANFGDLQRELLERHPDYHIVRKDNDTEVILHYLAKEMQASERPDLVTVFRNLSEKFDGAYNIVFLNAQGDLVVSRDPLGIRPMCYAFDGRLFAAASESIPLQNLGFASSQIHSLAPGQLALVRDGKFSLHTYAESKRTAHCFFEWIYFSNVGSTLDGRSVYLSRSALGKELAEQERRLNLFPIDSDDTIVVPVPDTGKAAADAMAFELGIPSREGLIRNRYVGRTFIEGGNRADKVRLKFTPLREVLEGKRVLLVEDSIVRSTTLKTLLNYVRDVGKAREIHVRVACPPIIAPCFYGIDMSTVTELYAPSRMAGAVPTLEEQQAMAAELGADSLLYLPVESVANCLEMPPERLCRACLTRDYPTPTGEQLYQLSLRTKSEEGRTYESGIPVTGAR
ncbi:MAG: amidophosphoribosyltransferase [Gemmataceae bacterium]|nr:amidophosphoribosyltransferase [Planctomycetia bacterium]MBX3398128.1 amidophosphoribosyltransferase [Gemmataceae bacterium]